MGRFIIALMIAFPAAAQVRVKENIKQYDLGDPPSLDQQQPEEKPAPAPKKRPQKPQNDAAPKE